ncbi:MAG: AAA family ATPase, partial [Candidatus Bathyarchaeia archaeon]
AVRSGGILHIDEANLINPAILMRLNELMDNKRQLNMQEFNGEIIKAHPDLFIILTMNPPKAGYEGAKKLPDPIMSRLTPFYLDYPPEDVEYKIVEANLRSVGVKPSEFAVKAGEPTGRFAPDVVKFMKLVRNLREAETELSYVPSTRETISFVRNLTEGDTFKDAIHKTVGNWYAAEPEEQEKFRQALDYVHRGT